MHRGSIPEPDTVTVDQSILQQMKNCSNSECFTSPTFEIEGLLWQLEAYPNGDGEDRVWPL